MRIDVVRLRETSGALRQTWSVLCDGSNPPLSSPFYRPEFSELVDQVRGDVEVAVVEDAGAVAALLPFHRLRGNVGRPVGLHLNDFQGFVGNLPSGTQAQDVVQAARLRAFDFDHVPTVQSCFAAGTALTDASPFIDLHAGIEAYERARNEKSHDLRDSARRLRKLGREHGTVRIEHGIDNSHVLGQLLDWKRRQFERTAVPDVLAVPWVLECVEALARQKQPQFAGVLSALWAGDRLVAAELGPRSGGVYHLQWCAYDPDFHAYSPGRLLGESMIRWCATHGISRIEYGKGDHDYKRRAATGEHRVATGSIACGAFQRAVRGAWWSMRRWARSSRLRPHLKSAASLYFRLRKTAPATLRGEA